MAQTIGYWSRLCALGALMAAAMAAQTLTELSYLNGSNGAKPMAAPVEGLDANLYGTTNTGGAYGGGTVFKLASTGGALTTLYSFCAQANCADGLNPSAGLVLGTDGNFYGTTVYGGANTCPGGGCGTVFSITPAGVLTTLHSFASTDGAYPLSALMQAADGNFYGTTYAGGPNNFGTVFKISASGVLTTLHSFAGIDGASPLAGLVQAPSGVLYGTTYAGGSKADGTVFRMAPTGKLTTLHSFCSRFACLDGIAPVGPLVAASDGNFYGTTEAGGTSNAGTVFKITPNAILTTLHNFAGGDGASPSSLLQATDGNFYGVTYSGGSSTACTAGCGTIFQITSAGTLTTEYNFDSTHGAAPQGLVQQTGGAFYGTCLAGGPYGDGTLFLLNMGLSAFVETVPGSGIIGAPVTIVGGGLTGATSVTFNGVAAVFTVVSNTEISTTVPSGATAGIVTVKVPGRTLNSNVVFHIP